MRWLIQITCDCRLCRKYNNTCIWVLLLKRKKWIEFTYQFYYHELSLQTRTINCLLGKPFELKIKSILDFKWNAFQIIRSGITFMELIKNNLISFSSNIKTSSTISAATTVNSCTATTSRCKSSEATTDFKLKSDFGFTFVCPDFVFRCGSPEPC